jgi:uroporphyrinogen-III synthase
LAGNALARLVLVTRPAERADRLVRLLSEAGWTPLLAPVLEARPTGAALPGLDRYQALVFTSAAGVRAFAEQSKRRDLPVYTVGEATAEAARAEEFPAVRAAGGDLQQLNLLLAGVPERSLLHVSGEQVAGEVAAAKRTVDRVALYRTVVADRLPPAASEALYARTVEAVSFLSPRTVAAFICLADAGVCEGVRALCLGPSIAEAARGRSWASVEVAAAPTLADLVGLLGKGPDR